jgi:hypothetical protein
LPSSTFAAAIAHGMVQVTKPLGFIARHGLWTDDQRRQAEDLKRRIETDKLHLVRLAWADPHGASRAKALTPAGFLAALTSGHNINVATTTLDSANARTFNSFTRGGGDGPRRDDRLAQSHHRSRPLHLSRVALGARCRLGAVRRIFQQRRAVSFLASAVAAPASRAACRERHGLARGPRNRMVPAARRG